MREATIPGGEPALLERRFLHPRYWGTWVVLGALRVAGLLPYAGRVAVGHVLGRALHPVMGRRRRIAQRNVELCFPALDARGRRRLVRRHFASLGIALVEMGAAWWAPESRLRGLGRVTGIEHLQRALAAGRGAILLSAHFTGMEMGLRLFSMIQPCYMIYRPHNDPLIDRVVQRGRSRHPGQMFSREDLRTMIAALRRNQPVWYPPDQDHGRRHSVFAEFFGRPASTLTTTARIARMSGAPVIPFYHLRLPGMQGYELRLLPPLEDFPSGDDVRDARRANEVLESQIRTHPEQYLWVHRRFKTTPRGEVYPYHDMARS